MAQRPAPPPWGVLMTKALVRAKLSAREAARRAGISEGRWRQIASGYQVVSAGVYAPVRGPAGTLARMAAVVGVTPAQLRRAGRTDAARALAAAPAEADVGQELLQRVRAMNSDQARELLATIALQLGLRLQAEPAPGRERRQGALPRGAVLAPRRGVEGGSSRPPDELRSEHAAATAGSDRLLQGLEHGRRLPQERLGQARTAHSPDARGMDRCCHPFRNPRTSVSL